MKGKRILISLLLTVLVYAPLPMLYGKLDTEAVPPEMAALAVPAKRYELCIRWAQRRSLGEREKTIWLRELKCYDQQDRLVRHIEKRSEETVPYYTDYEYDAQGNELSCTISAENYKIYGTNAYDEAGRILEHRMRAIDNKGELRSETATLYTYDSSGAGKAVYQSDEDGRTKKLMKWTLDENGNTVSGRELQFPYAEQSYAYDEQGNPTRFESVIDGEATVKEYRRTYDADGNCIRCRNLQKRRVCERRGFAVCERQLVSCPEPGHRRRHERCILCGCDRENRIKKPSSKKRKAFAFLFYGKI